jgi:hypothetical protein
VVLYIRSIYWAVYSLSSIGYYDILPTNATEITAVTVILFFGCQMFNGVLGRISTVMNSFTKDLIAHQTKLSTIKELASRKGISNETRDKIYYYFEYAWTRSKGVDEATILSQFPISIRKIIVKDVAGSLLRKIPFFVDCNELILYDILGVLRPRVFINGDA